MILSILSPRLAYSYHYLVGTSYSNCLSCHFSPNGNFPLRVYGKAVADELATFRTGSKPLENFSFVARFVQAVGIKNKTLYARPVLMQASPIVQVSEGNLSAFIEFQNVGRTAFEVTARVDKLLFTAGRFFPTYGLMVENHKHPIRARWPPYSEPYSLRLGYLNDGFDLYLTYSYFNEMYLRTSYSYKIFKTGVSASLDSAGIFGILGVRPFTLLFEVDWQNFQSPTYIYYARLEYLLARGLTLYATSDIGLGLRWLIIPNIQVTAQWQENYYFFLLTLSL